MSHADIFRRAFQLLSKTQKSGGDLLEFGVYKGSSLIAIDRYAKKYGLTNYRIFGFDTFSGMPPTQVQLHEYTEGWAKGTFGDTSLDFVKTRLQNEGIDAKLIAGLFSEISLSSLGIEKVRFVHLDADIYEGYRDALQLITPCVHVGTVMVFDEIVPVPGRERAIRAHGKKAVEEWVDETKINLFVLKEISTTQLSVIVDDEFLKVNRHFLESIRRDTVMETTKKFLRTIARKLFSHKWAKFLDEKLASKF